MLIISVTKVLKNYTWAQAVRYNLHENDTNITDTFLELLIEVLFKPLASTL